jgi:hypothetical protein
MRHSSINHAIAAGSCDGAVVELGDANSCCIVTLFRRIGSGTVDVMWLAVTLRRWNGWGVLSAFRIDKNKKLISRLYSSFGLSLKRQMSPPRAMHS